MGCARLSESANNLVIGAAWAPKLRPRRWHAEVIGPPQHRWLSVQVGAHSAQVLFHKQAF